MKKLAFSVIILFLTAGTLSAKEYEVTKKAGGYAVDIRIDKNPPIVGDNNISIAVKDASGQSVTDAKIKVDYSMPAMPGMPAMNYKTDAELKGGEYKAVMNLSMSGSWNVSIKVARGGKTVTFKFSVDAH